MSTSILPSRPRFRALAGTFATVVVLGAIAVAGVVIVLTAAAVAGTVAGGLFAWSRASSGRSRGRRSLYV